MSYSVTMSLKVGGGQDEIILLGVAKIVTRTLTHETGDIKQTIQIISGKSCFTFFLHILVVNGIMSANYSINN